MKYSFLDIQTFRYTFWCFETREIATISTFSLVVIGHVLRSLWGRNYSEEKLKISTKSSLLPLKNILLQIPDNSTTYNKASYARSDGCDEQTINLESRKSWSISIFLNTLIHSQFFFDTRTIKVHVTYYTCEESWVMLLRKTLVFSVVSTFIEGKGRWRILEQIL